MFASASSFTPWIFKILVKVSLRSFLFTITSTKPCSRRYSAVWKLSGNFYLNVCSITRLPANPIRAFGSAKIKSPNIAKLAVTPPVVGWVNKGI